MTPDPQSHETAQNSVVPRKPCFALMGEFSAGKSTLANLMMGLSVSPVQVTATQLPPVWYSRGAPSAVRVDRDGTEHPISLEDLDQVSPKETRLVRIFLESDVLDFCDLIDMPGTSDPNLDSEMWKDTLSHADGVIWCTPSTQAWRQSEAALWDQMPEWQRLRSLLLITRIDKLLTERDRKKVLARVKREVDDGFRSVFPISLTEALAAEEASEEWSRSGAEEFVVAFMNLVEEVSAGAPATPVAQQTEDKPQATGMRWMDRLPSAVPVGIALATDEGPQPAAEAAEETQAADAMNPPPQTAETVQPNPVDQVPQTAVQPKPVAAEEAGAGAEPTTPAAPSKTEGVLPRRVAASGSSRARPTRRSPSPLPGQPGVA